jgi:hypothetical protein
MRVRGLLPAVIVATVALSLGPRTPAAAAHVPPLAQRYEIDATLDAAAGRLDAVEEIQLTNRSRVVVAHVDLAVVPRALGWFALEGDVTVDGLAIEPDWTTSISLRVPLALPPGGSTTIAVPFSLTVGTSPEAFSARTSRQNGVLSFGQWFPIVSIEHEVYGLGDPQISFTAETIRLQLTTTTSLPATAVACPGLVETPAGEGTAWTCEAERVRDFSFVVNPRFRLTERTVDGIAIRVYTETVSGDITADLAADGLSRLSETYGAYPWPDLVLAEVGAGGGFSMEYPRMIHLTRGKVADPYVVYHEVAHQWFYAQVGNDQQREPWLDEAMADFTARMLMGIGENHCSSRPVDSDVFAWPAEATTGGDWTSCDGYFHAVFYRGTEFLTTVRQAMGDDAFFGAMRTWVDRNRHGYVTADRFLGHLAAASAADLQPIFAAYLAEPEVTPPKAATRVAKAG